MCVQVGDPEELAAIDKVFCTDRKEPLLIGSIKSSIGHSEPASGLCSMVKCIISMETGLLVPNIHFNTPRKGVKGFEEDRMRVVVDATPWPGGLIGINSFGFGGSNCHILLQSNSKEKVDGGQPKDGLPRVIAVSGRTPEAIDVMLDDVRAAGLTGRDSGDRSQIVEAGLIPKIEPAGPLLGHFLLLTKIKNLKSQGNSSSSTSASEFCYFWGLKLLNSEPNFDLWEQNSVPI